MASGRRFLLFSANELIGEAMREQLVALPETKGLILTTDIEEALDLAKKDFFDAVIVDENIKLCEELRHAGYPRTIILIETAEQEPEDETDISAFIEKPFRWAAFIARLYQSILSHEAKAKKGFNMNNLYFDTKSKTVVLSPAKVKHQLTEKEADILTYLYRAGGKIVDRDTLLREVWGYNAEVTTHTLETHIYRLRQKIDTNPDNSLIISEDGGYKIAVNL